MWTLEAGSPKIKRHQINSYSPKNPELDPFTEVSSPKFGPSDENIPKGWTKNAENSPELTTFEKTKTEEFKEVGDITG